MSAERGNFFLKRYVGHSCICLYAPVPEIYFCEHYKYRVKACCCEILASDFTFFINLKIFVHKPCQKSNCETDNATTPKITDSYIDYRAKLSVLIHNKASNFVVSIT